MEKGRRMRERVRKWSRLACFCHAAALSLHRTDPPRDQLRALSVLSLVPSRFLPWRRAEPDAGDVTSDIGGVMERHYHLWTWSLGGLRSSSSSRCDLKVQIGLSPQAYKDRHMFIESTHAEEKHTLQQPPTKNTHSYELA